MSSRIFLGNIGKVHFGTGGPVGWLGQTGRSKHGSTERDIGEEMDRHGSLRAQILSVKIRILLNEGLGNSHCLKPLENNHLQAF